MITGIIRIQLSGDVADYGMDSTIETIEEYKEYLLTNTDCEDIEINYNSNAELWEVDEDVDEQEIKAKLWEDFCSEYTR
jgi:hypothetical protein